jgi:hypothetical protein
MFKYGFYASRYGGEHTIGTIPKKVAEYWLDKGADAFKEYMLDWNHDEINDSGTIPEEDQLPNWYEVDDIDHMCTIEFADTNTLTVFDVTNKKDELWSWGEEIAEIAMTENKIDSVGDETAIIKIEEEWNELPPSNDEYIVYGQSFEKGSVVFETLETKEPFDASKLKFNISKWNDLYLVNSLSYDGVELENMGMEGFGKSMACWIDD